MEDERQLAREFGGLEKSVIKNQWEFNVWLVLSNTTHRSSRARVWGESTDSFMEKIKTSSKMTQMTLGFISFLHPPATLFLQEEYGRGEIVETKDKGRWIQDKLSSVGLYGLSFKEAQQTPKFGREVMTSRIYATGAWGRGGRIQTGMK